ncbi:MAG: hypothetical protein P1U70_25400 [Saprospiraceae bacterium]|nr:hypothetical protein [Saprospiraceae bacterium]
MKVKILAKDNTSPGNGDMKKFLDKYIKVLLQKGVRFDFQIVEKSHIKKLKKKGITGLPAMLTKESKRPIIGSDKIIAKFAPLVGLQVPGAPRAPAPRRELSAEEELREYQRGIMNKEAMEMEGDEDSGHDFERTRSKMDEMQRDRQNRFKRENERSGFGNGPGSSSSSGRRVDNIDITKTTTEDIKAAAGNNSDDQMLAAMFDQTDDVGEVDYGFDDY